MSGICGIVHFDGAPADGRLLRDMTAYMAYRGPDAQDVWLEGRVGLGHAMLRTTFEAEHESQPCSLDGKIWITADARIDGQRELKGQLAAQYRSVRATATDAELILHAYHAWGEDCVKHLIGDFAFAIWDGPRQRLFCARDHFGVKPLFYAQAAGALVFSNTLNCIRRHPLVCAELNDLAIADFLLFEANQDPATTAFADIRRLAPAHCLSGSAQGLRTIRYWTLPAEAQIRYRSEGDYVEHFRALLQTAVADRLRSDRVAISMSGGLDSSAIAATAKGLFDRQSQPFELHAHTVVYDRLIRDRERHFSGMVARDLAIPIHYCVADDYKLYERFGGVDAALPEPSHAPDAAVSSDALKASSAQCRVMLTGWDGDALLNESPKPYFRKLLGDRKYLSLLGGVIRYAVSQRRLLPVGFRRRLALRPANNDPVPPPYPAWLDPGLEKRLGLRERWESVYRPSPPGGGIRPYAHRVLSSLAATSHFFDGYDPGVSRLPLECRHPLLDLRLVDYCLSLPPLPWCVKKTILRAAMRGRLPEPVRLRPKTPLAAWPVAEMLRQADAQWVDHFEATPALAEYVNRNKIPKTWGEGSPEEAWANLRPLSLNFWFHDLQGLTRQTRGYSHEFA